MNLLLTILVAAAGSYLFYKFRIPAGALIGAIIFSAALNIITGVGTFPGFMKTVLQAVAGAFIGRGYSDVFHHGALFHPGGTHAFQSDTAGPGYCFGLRYACRSQ